MDSGEKLILFIGAAISFAALSALVERYSPRFGWLVILLGIVVLTIIGLVWGARDPEFENWQRRYRAKQKLDAGQLRREARELIAKSAHNFASCCSQVSRRWSMSWRYRITDADHKLVESEGGFSTEKEAHEAASKYLKKLASSPDYRVSRNYTITASQEQGTAN